MADQAKDLLKHALKYAQDGKLDKAIECYLSIIKKNPKDARVLNNLGDIYLRKKMMAEAVNIFNNLTQLYEAEGYTLRAIAICQKVLKIDPEAVSVKVRLSELYARQGLVAEARAQYLDLANLYDRKGQVKEALEIFRKLADLDPANYSVRAKLGNMFHKEGMLDKAAAEWNKAAEGLLKAGEEAEARELLEKIVQAEPEGAKARIMLAGEAIKGNQYDRVIEILQPVVDTQTADLEALKLYAAALLKKQSWAEASIVLKRALDKEPSSLPIRENLGLALLKAGRYEQAADHLQKIISAHLRENRWDRAEKLALELRQEKPDDAQALQKLVEIYLKSGRREPLIASYKELAALYEERGLKKNVLGVYEKLLEAEPANPRWKAKVNELEGALGVKYEEKPEIAREEVLDIQLAEESLEEKLGIMAGEETAVQELSVEAEREVLPAETPMAAAENLLRQGRFKEAESMLLAMLAAGPAPQPLRMLKELYRLQGNIPAYVETCCNLAADLESRELYDEAVLEYQEILKVDRTNRKAEEALADLVLRLGLEAPAKEAEIPKAAEEEQAEEVGIIEIPETDLEAAGDLELEKLAGEISVEEEPPVREAEPTFGAIPAPPETVAPAVPSAPEGVQEAEELLAEADFYHQQGLIGEAEKIYRLILSRDPGREDVARRLQDLAARTEEAAGLILKEEELADLERSLGLGLGPVKPEVTFSVASEERHEGVVDRSGDFTDFLSDLKEEVEGQAAVAEPAVEDSLQAIFQEFQQGVREKLSAEDYETHYNLGIAYKEMGLLEEAIVEFELAAKSRDFYIDAVSMIALCHKDKGELERAASAIQGALDNLPGDVDGRKGLLWELAGIFEQMGEKQKAVDLYLSVYEQDDSYRGIQEKLKELSALRKKETEAEEGKVQIKEEESSPEKKSRRVSYI